MNKKTDSTQIAEDEKLTRGQRLWNRLVVLRRTAPISLERAKLQTASYKETEGLPPALRRARIFEKIVTEIPIYIDEEQLLVGDLGSWSMAAEFLCDGFPNDWILDKFEENKGYMVIKDEDVPVIKDLARYWHGKTTEELYFSRAGREEEKKIRAIDIRGANILAPIHLSIGWNAPGFDKVIAKGLKGLLTEVEEELAKSPVLDEKSYHKKFFLEGLVITIKAAMQYAGRYADLARKMAKTAKGKRKAELEKMAEICEWVPANPARTFWEAIQSLWFWHVLLYWDIPHSGISPGRVDQYLNPYFKKDVEEGRITREEAVQLLELLRCKYSALRAFVEKLLDEGGTGEAEWNNCTLGGVTPTGEDATNEMSYMWLEAASRVGSPHPTLSVRVHENSNEAFIMRAAEVCREGHGYPAWFGDRTNISYLMNQGIKLEEARDFAMAGCTLAVIPGRMCGARVFFGNIAKMFEMTLNNGVDPTTHKQLGPRTGKVEDFKTFNDLWTAFVRQTGFWLEWATSLHNESEIFFSITKPSLISSLMYDDCIKRGLPSNGGGCRYQQGMWYLLPTGPIDVADSMAAIKKCVYEDKLVNIKQLMNALAANFEGEEHQKVRRLLLAAPKYGNDDDYVDLIARDIYTMLDRTLSTIDGPFGTKYVCSPHSVASHGPMGKIVGALPSGRSAWVALADGNMSPCQGMDKKGPTAVIRSAGKIDQIPLQGTLFNQKFHPNALKTKDDLRKFTALIKTYLIDYGGKHVQFNVVDRKTLLAAQAHPEDYKSLVVRVAGYSALWVELTRIVQDEIIARTEQNW